MTVLPDIYSIRNRCKRYILLFHIILPVLFAVSCKKHKEEKLIRQLPPISADGRGTFACIMNNKEVYKSEGNYEAPSMAILSTCRGGNDVYHTSHRVLEIFSTVCPKADLRFNITIADSIHPGIYSLNKASGNIFKIEKTLSEQAGYSVMQIFENDSSTTGTLTLTRTDSIYSGTFEVTLYDVNHFKMNITHGRFDIWPR